MSTRGFHTPFVMLGTLGEQGLTGVPDVLDDAAESYIRNSCNVLREQIPEHCY